MKSTEQLQGRGGLALPDMPPLDGSSGLREIHVLQFFEKLWRDKTLPIRAGRLDHQQHAFHEFWLVATDTHDPLAFRRKFTPTSEETRASQRLSVAHISKGTETYELLTLPQLTAGSLVTEVMVSKDVIDHGASYSNGKGPKLVVQCESPVAIPELAGADPNIRFLAGTLQRVRDLLTEPAPIPQGIATSS